MGGRFRTFGSRAVATLCFVFLFTICAAPVIASEPRLVYAKTDSWQTDLLFSAIDGDYSLDVSNCKFGLPGLGSYLLHENETAIVPNYGALLCGDAIGTTTAKEDGIGDLTVVARYRDAEGYTATFEIPPLYAHLPDTVDIRPIQNDDATSTFLVFFNEGSSGALITISVFNEKNALAGTETLTLSPGLSTHMLATNVRAGRLEIRDGLPLCGHCATGQTVYGFAAIGLRAGGSPRIAPFSYR